MWPQHWTLVYFSDLRQYTQYTITESEICGIYTNTWKESIETVEGYLVLCLEMCWIYAKNKRRAHWHWNDSKLNFSVRVFFSLSSSRLHRTPYYGTHVLVVITMVWWCTPIPKIDHFWFNFNRMWKLLANDMQHNVMLKYCINMTTILRTHHKQRQPQRFGQCTMHECTGTAFSLWRCMFNCGKAHFIPVGKSSISRHVSDGG